MDPLICPETSRNGLRRRSRQRHIQANHASARCSCPDASPGHSFQSPPPRPSKNIPRSPQASPRPCCSSPGVCCQPHVPTSHLPLLHIDQSLTAKAKPQLGGVQNSLQLPLDFQRHQGVHAAHKGIHLQPYGFSVGFSWRNRARLVSHRIHQAAMAQQVLNRSTVAIPNGQTECPYKQTA